MPKTTKSGNAKKSELPSTLKSPEPRPSAHSPRRTTRPSKSTAKARAHRVAYDALKHSYDVARRLDISGRSTMSKDELVSAIKKATDARRRAAS